MSIILNFCCSEIIRFLPTEKIRGRGKARVPRTGPQAAWRSLDIAPPSGPWLGSRRDYNCDLSEGGIPEARC